MRARDRRCRFPGCRRRVPEAGELDHHRGKHQAPGWTHTLAPDGTLTVTTPTGLTAITTPPPY